MSDDKERRKNETADSDENREDPVKNTREKAEEAVREYSEKSAETVRKSAESAKKLGEESSDTARRLAEQSKAATRHFAEKARALGDKTPEITSHVLEQTTKFTRDVFGRLHEGWSNAYEASSKFVQEAYHSTSSYADRHKNTGVMKKLTAEREKLNQKLGSVIYTKYKDEGVAPEELFQLDEVREILTECENVDNEVLRIGAELDKKKG